MGQTLLVNQFVAGLRPELKRKLIGIEGGLEELVLKARFEEVKAKELISDRSRMGLASRNSRPAATTTSAETLPVTTSAPAPPSNATTESLSKSKGCFNCGMEGHRARRCPYPKKTKRDEEARGVLLPARPAQVSTTSALIEEDEETNSQLERLSQRLEKLENEFIHKREQLLNTVAAETEAGGHLGPSVLAEVSVNGVPTQALVDTGSPATVISLDFLLGILVKERSEQQTPAEWCKATLAKFSPPSVVMRGYSGHKLNILAQMNVSLSYRSCTIEATVLVQDGAPRNLLLGTDVQLKLGFALVAQVGDKLTDLLTKKRVVAAQAVTTQDGSEAPPNHVRRDSQLEEDPPSVPRDATRSNDCLLVTDSDSEGTVATQPRDPGCLLSRGTADRTGEAGDGGNPRRLCCCPESKTE